MAPRDFRYQIDDGPWVYETQELPFTIEGVTNANAVKVQPIGAVVSVSPVTTITAVITPVMPRVYEGQTLSEIPNWSDFVSTENYDSTVGEIDRVEISFTGDAVDAVTPFVLGESVGFTARAVNEFEQGESFVTVRQTVEYKVNVTLDGQSRELIVDINDLVPDEDTFSFTLVSGTDYDDDYSDIPVGAVRNGPYHYGAHSAAALPEVTGDTALNQALSIVDDGMMSSPTGDLTITYQWQVDDGGWASIPDETTKNIVVSSEIQGHDIRPGIVMNDGENDPVTFYGAAIEIPAAVVTDPPSATVLTSSIQNADIVSYSPHAFSIDLDAIGAGEEGDEILFLIGYALRYGTGGEPYYIDFLADDVAQDLIEHRDSGGRFRTVTEYRVNASGGGVMNFSAWPQVEGDQFSGFTIYPILLKNHNAVSFISEGSVYQTGTPNPHVFSTLDVFENDILLGLGRSINSSDLSPSVNDLDMEGVDVIDVKITSKNDGTQRSWLFRKDIAASQADYDIGLNTFNAPLTNITLNTLFLRIS